MSEDVHRDSPEADQKQLCISCMAPNEPSAHFCVKCGAPLSSYASTGPFEGLFAEGAVYRQAAEHPQRLVVVLGVWLIFGMMAMGGLVLIGLGRDSGFLFALFGAGLFVTSLVMILKTTRNYMSRKKVDVDEKNGDPPTTPQLDAQSSHLEQGGILRWKTVSFVLVLLGCLYLTFASVDVFFCAALSSRSRDFAPADQHYYYYFHERSVREAQAAFLHSIVGVLCIGSRMLMKRATRASLLGSCIGVGILMLFVVIQVVEGMWHGATWQLSVEIGVIFPCFAYALVYALKELRHAA